MGNRRSFLGSAGAAVVYRFVDGGAQLRAAQANSQIGFGFIGSGIRGTQLIEEFRLPAVKPVAVCDVYDGCLARAKEQIDPGIFTTKDYRAVLDRKDVDAVVIAVPDHLHKQFTLDALAAGKHVYIEKPLTWSIEEGPAIIAAEKASRKILQVGSQAKTGAMAAKARELIKAGTIGKVHMVRMANHRANAMGAWKYPVPPDASPRTIDWARFLGHYPAKPFDARTFFQWRCWWEYSGGVATDLYVHLLTWLHEVLDVKAPSAVSSHGGIYKWADGRTVPDYMNSLFEYPEGFVVDIYVNLATSAPSRTSAIHGTEGTLIDEKGTLVLYHEPVDHGVQNYGTLQWPKAARAKYFESHGWTADGRPKEPREPVEPKEIVVERGPTHAEWFVISVRDNKPSRENATEGHLAAGAAHMANMSYRQKRRIAWDWRANTLAG